MKLKSTLLVVHKCSCLFANLVVDVDNKGAEQVVPVI
jgi:hypothetical protein